MTAIRTYGSVLNGTVNVRWKSVMTYLEVESDEPRERIIDAGQCRQALIPAFSGAKMTF